MKKHYIMIVFILLGCIFSAKAQFKMETGVANYGVRLGVGFPKMDKFKLGELNPVTPALGVVFDLGIFGKSGLAFGGEINYAKFDSDSYGKLGVISVIAILKYYTPLTFNKVATYGRADIIPTNLISSQSKLQNIFGIYAGADYRLTNSFGVFAELGTGYTTFNTGVSFRVER